MNSLMSEITVKKLDYFFNGFVMANNIENTSNAESIFMSRILHDDVPLSLISDLKFFMIWLIRYNCLF